MILSMNSQDLLEGLNIVTRALSSRPAKQILEGGRSFIKGLSIEDRQAVTTFENMINSLLANAPAIVKNK